MLDEAIKEARKTMNNNVGGPFGALITDKDNNIIAVASNTVLGSHDPTAHAEINVIRRAAKKLKMHDLSGYKLYTTSYPCPMCISAIIWANIKEVYYGTSIDAASQIGFRDDYIYDFIKSNCNDKNILSLNQIEEDKCLNLFKEYKEDNRKLY